MTLARLNTTDKVFLGGSTLVGEHKIKAKVHGVKKPKIIFHGEYLNPAMAIIFTGHVSCGENEKIIKKPFAVVSHTVGVGSKDKDQLVFDYCNDVIGNIFSNTESSLQARGIEVSASYFIRCQQTEEDNQQELAASRFKEILATPTFIADIVDDSVLDHELVFSTDYTSHFMEERENLAVDGDSDGIHFFVQALPSGKAQIFFYKGFETIDKLVCNKEKDSFAQSRFLLLSPQPRMLAPSAGSEAKRSSSFRAG